MATNYLNINGSANTDGKIPIGTTGGLATWATITSSGGTVAITNGPGSINLETAGFVATQYTEDAGSASPLAGNLNIFGGEMLNTSGAASTVTVHMDRGTDGQIPIAATGAPTAYANITSTGGTIAVTDGPNTINLEANTLASTSSFFAYLGASVTNVTGDGTTYQAIYGSTLYNNGSDYNTGTGVYTAPVTGLYNFTVSTFLSGLLVAHDDFRVRLIPSTLGPVAGIRQDAASMNTSGFLQATFTCDVPLNAGETVHVAVAVFNGTKVVGLLSDGTSSYITYWSGRLVG